ncbi:hypothetical protein EDC04DRAFT_2913639 [Pisolithus marmoratus]|nr:hypothetical protein EDC04DRAFT_2913639 [Pisolithus marmoratus]
MDTAQPSSPKVVKGSPQTRPAIKKPRLQSISPLSSELSSEEEVETHPSGDQLNVTSPRVSVEHQQSSGELHVEQPMGLQATLSPPQGDQLSSMPFRGSCHDQHPNLPS